MKIDREKLTVVHNESAKRFEVHVEDMISVLEYRSQDDLISFTHTGVPPALEGNGIGSLIVRAGLDYAREQGYRVEPLCSFVDAYIRRHAEYADLVT